MLELILNRLSRDKNRLKWIKEYNNLSTMIKTIVKGDRTWGIKESDFDCITNMSITELIDMFIKVRKDPKWN